MNYGFFNFAVESVREGINLVANMTELEDWEHKHLSQLYEMRKMLPTINNEYINKRRALVGDGFKVLPYLINDDLTRKKKQPKYLSSIIKRYKGEGTTIAEQMEDLRSSADVKEDRFRRICRRELEGKGVMQQERHQNSNDRYRKTDAIKTGNTGTSATEVG